MVLVEFALVLPVLMILLLGMFSGANAWNQKQAISHGARVAARFASTLPIPDDDPGREAWLDDIADRAVGAAEGAMVPDVAGRALCVAYVDPAGTAPDETVSRRTDEAGVVTTHADACFDDGQGDDAQRVQVVLERDGILDIGFRRQHLDLRGESVYRYEVVSGI